MEKTCLEAGMACYGQKIWEGEESMKINKIFRAGVRIKEIGERMACIRVKGVPVLRWACGPVIRLGLAVREFALGNMCMEAL